VYSIQTVLNEYKESYKYNELTYVEFQEFLVRCAFAFHLESKKNAVK